MTKVVFKLNNEDNELSQALVKAELWNPHI